MSIPSRARFINAISVVSPRLAGRMAFSLYCSPPERAEVKDSEKAIHEAAAVDALQVEGISVATYRWGTGDRTVLLVHGFQARASRWAHFVPQLLDEGYTVVAYDAPGHGASGGVGATILDHFAVIRAIQDRYGRFAAIVAHSFGVPCVFYAVRNGVEADRLVSIGGVCEFASVSETFCTQLRLRPVVNKDLRRRSEKFFEPERNIWDRFSVSHEPSTVRASILVVHDKDDREVTSAEATKIMNAFGDRARLMTTEKLGHRRILTNDSVVAEVARFVSTASAME